MTPPRQRVLDFIRDRIAATGCAPTYAEMARTLGRKGTGAIHEHVSALVADGRLVRVPGVIRGLRLATVDLSGVPTAEIVAELARREAHRG